MINKINLLKLAAVMLIGISVTGCNTVDGAGRDLEHAGEAVQDASQDAAN